LPSLEADVLQTRVFFKPTDTHQLLDKHSFHPKHTSKGVLKSQLLRFKRISSCVDDYNNACSILFEALRKRNYSKSLLRKMKRDIWLDNQDLHPKDKTLTDKLLPIIIPYNNVGISLVRTWKKAISQNEIFKDARLIAAYCNSKNLHKHLIRSEFTAADAPNAGRRVDRPIENRFVGSRRCPSLKCKACNYIVEANSFTSSENGRTFKLTSGFTCKSSNICYLVTCRACRKQYVGETGRSLAERITDHLSAIRLNKPTPIGVHFNQQGHSNKHFSILAIDKFDDAGNCLNFRRLKETTWQHLLQTAHPLGINNLKLTHLKT
jgi:hypothetical protein